MKPSSVSIILAGVLLAAPALAAGASAAEGQARITSMEQQARELGDAARNMKGAHQQELLRRRARLDSLIERLRAGERVDPEEVDALLGK